MNSCRVQFVVRNMDTKDKTLQINSVECKISDTRRITNQISQIAIPQQFGLFLSSELSTFWRMVKNLCLGVDVAESEDEKFGVVYAVEFSPERLDFRID